MDDRLIVNLYLERNETAICETAAKYGTRLRALARGITEDDGIAEECENDTYLEAWNRIPPNTPRDYLYPFLACIARHLSLNRCRDRRRQTDHITQLSEEMEACLPAPGSDTRHADDVALRDALNGFLAALSEEKRNLFLRRYWFADSIADIATRYRLSESKVKTTLHRTREALREHLRKEGFEP